MCCINECKNPAHYAYKSYLFCGFHFRQMGSCVFKQREDFGVFVRTKDLCKTCNSNAYRISSDGTYFCEKHYQQH